MGAKSSKDKVSQPSEGQMIPAPRNENEAGKTRIATIQVKLPHNHEDILKDADGVVDRTSTEKLCDQLYDGVFLNQHKKKYWVDKSLKNCFMLYAKDLSITWAEDSSYWHWPLIEGSSDVPLAAAELLHVCWLEVYGRFNIINLTPETLYEVIFVVMLKDSASGWERPVNFKLSLPNGINQEHKENMMEEARGEWIEISAGEFETSSGITGEMHFSLYEYGAIWKGGLLIKGVQIRPKQ